jgi:hypothetical protein
MTQSQKRLDGIFTAVNKLIHMKMRAIICGLCLVSSICSIFAQDHSARDTESLLRDLFEPDSRTNLIIKGYTACPPRLTNVISNTNLFTPSEQKLLKEIQFKYKDVTTNSGPLGTVLTGVEKISNYYVAHFSYTNSDVHEDIIFGDRSAEARHNGNYDDFMAGFDVPLVRYRTKDGNGYDATISRSSDKFWTFAQIKQGKVNGLYVDFSNDHCQNLLHFVDGKAVGNWLQWDTYTDNHLLEVKIKSSLDYFRYMTQEIKM